MTRCRVQQVRADGIPGAVGAEGPAIGAGGPPRCPRTFYVDWAALEQRADRRSAQARGDGHTQASGSRRPGRVLGRVDRQVDGLRRNVRDSARAVLAWVSAVVAHEGQVDLNEVLDRCLRPGPDVQLLNYAALAREIRRTLHVRLSARRVRTAIEHLRLGRAAASEEPPRRDLARRVASLHDRLEAGHDALLRREAAGAAPLRRLLGVEVLAAVRCAAGHLIDHDYGEGIPGRVDLERLGDACLDLARCGAGDPPAGAGPAGSPGADLHRLLVTLCDFDGSAQSLMGLVVDGSRVVADLLGADSLAGVVARLNVLVAGRHLVETEFYCTHLLRLGRAAADLRDDPATASFMNWVRRLDEDRRLPSPIRVSSYCFNNVATHLFERLFRRELREPDRWLAVARACLDHMRRRDSGFRLIRTTHLIELTVGAELSGDASEVEAHFAGLGREAALDLLEDLARFDNCLELVRAAQRHAVRAIPQLEHQLVPIG